MKIIKDGAIVAELPDSPKNFDGGCRGGKVSVVVGDNEVELGRYATQEQAGEVVTKLRLAYMSGADTFDLP